LCSRKFPEGDRKAWQTASVLWSRPQTRYLCAARKHSPKKKNTPPLSSSVGPCIALRCEAWMPSHTVEVRALALTSESKCLHLPSVASAGLYAR